MKKISSSLMRVLFPLILLVAIFDNDCICEEKSLKLYILRHAETMANVTGDYSAQNQQTFSKKGKEQIANLPAQLKPYHFDHILVSPAYRTRHTLLPYLQENQKTAEIWPELIECCWQSEREVQPSRKLASKGPAIQVEKESLPYFSFRDADSKNEYAWENYADQRFQINKAASRIKDRFGHSGKSILLVTHHLSGARMIEELLSIEFMGSLYLDNAKIQHLEQTPNGAFRLIELNGHSVGDNLEEPLKDDQPKPLLANESYLMDREADWSYFDNNKSPDPSWNRISYNSADWKIGFGPFGYGDPGIHSTLQYGPDASHKTISYYFRTIFYTHAPSSYKTLIIRLMCDDGAILYCNGKEILRYNMPNSNVHPQTTALKIISGHTERSYMEYTIENNDVLTSGDNLIAAEIHQASGSSSDLRFNLELIGQKK